MLTQTSLSKKIGFGFFFLLSAVLAHSQVTSDFSSSADSWTVFDNNSGSSTTPTYNSTGGNPGGYISFSTTSTAVPFYFRAPSKFIGNQSASYNQTLTFDLRISTAGSDNSNGDIMILSPYGTLFYQLPSKPSSTQWSSYSISLNESLWHNGGIAAAAPNQIQMKQVLSNITNLQIRLKYLVTTGGTYTSQLDNVVLNTPTLNSPPSIISISPTAAIAGASITITGSNFNSTLTQNAVYFKGVKAAVTSATASQLTVTVPTGASYGSITVVNLASGLQGSSAQSFNPLFDNNKDFGGRIIPASMGRGYNVVLPTTSTASNGFGSMDKGDLDGDGWIDLVSTETSTAKIYAFRNLGTGGTVNASSFASAITLPSLSTIPGGSPSLSEVIVVDVDSDGKLDVAASTSGNYASGTGFLAVYRNTSTVGSISFASPLFFAYNYYNPIYMATGDLDVDGKTDFVFTTGTSPGNVFICQNLSTPGNIDFSFGASISATTTSGYSDIVIGDLTGDGKPEIVSPGYNATTLSIYQNNSTPGTISMGTPFAIPAMVSYTVQLVMTDLDADNKLDMAWSVYGSQYVYFAKNLYSSGTFNSSSFGSAFQVANKLSNPLGITVGDLNGDSKPDVIMSGYSDLAALQNVGTAGNLSSTSFLQTTLFQGAATGNVFGLSPLLADLDGDNKPEAVFVSSGGSLPVGATGVYIFHNESYPVPTISSVSPTSAATGATVALNGTYMYTGNVNPSIRLNKLASSISGSPTNTLTSITTPVGGISGKFNVTNHGLTGFSNYFNSSFSTGHIINSSSFNPSVDFALAFSPKDVLETADFDDDGRVDVVISDNNGVGIFQNAATAGQTITSGSLTKLATTYTPGANVIVNDIDGDGKVDLNGGSGINQNTSTGSTISFAANVYSQVSNPGGVASGDFNHDGKIDEAVTNGSANIQLYENISSKGTFVNNGNLSTYFPTPTTLSHPTGSAFGGNNSLVAADFDGDGYDDIAGASPSSNSFIIFKNLAVFGTISSASFAAGTAVATSSNPYGITANDFDGDGKIDIAVVHYSSTNVSVYRNTSSVGSISFAAAVNYTGPTFGYNISWQDLDGDGKAEIVTTRNPNPGTPSFSIFQNNSTSGSLNFSSAVIYAMTRYPQAIAFADINSDQKPDILIVGSGGSIAPIQALMVFQNVMVTPVITIDPQPASSYSLCDGATQIISTSASGTTNITYQWQIFNSGTGGYNDLANTSGYSNVATSSLTINTTGNFGTGTYRCKINGDYAVTVYTNTVSFTVNSIPTAPTASDMNFCPSNTVLLSASGGSNGNYIWYDQNGVISGQTNSTYTTPSISVTTPYSVAITNGNCTSTKTNLNAVAKTVPTAPTTSDVNFCPSNTVLLLASGGSNGNYIWYDQNGAIAGQTNSTYTTPTISTTTPYSVAITNGNCTSTKTNLNAVAKTVPSAPTTSDVNFCPSNTVLLSASGGSSGNYIWYDQNGVISGQTNSTCTTPTISITTPYSVAITNGNCISTKANLNAVAKTIPTAPTASDVNFCSSSSVLLTASGGSSGNYIWYDQNGVINGQTNSTYTTPTISVTTPYSVAITNGNCTSAKTNLNAVAQTVPAAPTTSDVNFCASSTVLLTATGGSNGNYIWYDQNGSVINGQVNSTYTPVLISSTAYSVAITNGICTSSKAAISAVSISCGAPVITPEPLSTNLGGKITLDLKPLISTPGSTLNLSSLQIITPPSSGAIASIDANGILTLDYNGKPFIGDEQITIKACDAKNQCATQNFSVDVIMADDIVIYNGISPDGANPKLILQYIDILPETKRNKVSIFDRWENLVWRGSNYDNSAVIFTGNSDSGNALPSGVYFYKIEFFSGRGTKTGFISLRR